MDFRLNFIGKRGIEEEQCQNIPISNPTQSEYAVEIRDAVKRYKGIPFLQKATLVLQSLNLNVPQSSVYALLGPSGCGKTTLLKCIIGNLKLDSGTIRVFGHPPGTPESGIPGRRLGYMPQDLCLYTELSIRENLRYFGKLAGMSNTELKEQCKFLIGLLNLPPKKAKVLNLSGGQKRRVSLAIALLHNPELLIVDEPTVGVDSLLRKRIWNYLYSQSKKFNKTIIITTHYIEEARMAGVIGMMHDGTILKEDTPDKLMLKYNCNTLEKVFLTICLDYEKSEKALPEEDLKYKTKAGNTANEDSQENSGNLLKKSSSWTEDATLMVRMKSSIRNNFAIPSYVRIQATVMKNFRRSFMDYRIYFALIVGPLLLLSLYALSFSGPPKYLPIGIFNEDEFGLGQSFLSCIDSTNLDIKYYKNFDDAQEAVAQGDSWGVIHVPQNFSQALMMRLLHGEHVDNVTVLESIIEVSLDFTSQPVLLAIHSELTAAFTTFAQRTLTRVGLDTSIAELAIKINDNVYSGTETETFLSFTAPGLAISFVQIVSLCLTVMSFFLERVSGQLERSNIAGLSSVETALSFAVSSCALILVPTAVVVVVLLVFFNVTCRGSFFLFALLLYLQGISGMTYGLLTSAICSSEITAVMFSFGGNLPNLILSGVFWPIQGMPWLLQKFCICLPNTYAIIGLRDIMSRGWSLGYSSVYLGFIVSSIWIVFFFVASAIFLRYRN